MRMLVRGLMAALENEAGRLGGLKVSGWVTISQDFTIDLNLGYKCRPFEDGEAHFYKSPFNPRLAAGKS